MATSHDPRATSIDWKTLELAGLGSLLDSEEGTQLVIELQGEDAAVVVNMLDEVSGSFTSLRTLAHCRG